MPTLDWLNRAEALTSADKVPYRVLEPVSEHGDGSAENLLIQGDNLDALKALLPFYRGRVKCIFIDPPYNTKSAFEHYDDNLEHSQWLSMMYPRLVLLRELLAENGSIWVTIDDNEGHYLKVLMDEVFGRKNFIATNVWQKRYSRDNNSAIGDVHDYVICYAINAERFKEVRNKIEPDAKTRSAYRNPNNDPRGPWRLVPMSGAELRPNQQYPVKTPSGKIIYPPEGRHWSVLEPKFLELVADGKVFFGKKGDSAPGLIRYFSEIEGLVPWTWWPHEDVGHTDESKKEIHTLFGKTDAFSTPKPERLLKRVLEIATNPGDLILDSFLGSGTTAAVAYKMGRRWIGIEMGAHAVTHCIPRLQKVIAGEQGGISQAVNWQGGGGFRFLRLGEPMFNADGSIHPAVRFATLASFVWMQETGAPLEIPPSPPFAKGGVAVGVSLTEEDRASDPTLKKGGGAAGGITPLLGVHEGRGIYLLFNGILGDKRPASGNVLTNEVLATIARICPHDGAKIIYGEACRLGAARLAAAGVTFKHIPYDVKAR